MATVSLGLQRLINGNWQIVDESDDSAPLITFSNECNDPEVVKQCFITALNYFTYPILDKILIPTVTMNRPG